MILYCFHTCKAIAF